MLWRQVAASVRPLSGRRMIAEEVATAVVRPVAAGAARRFAPPPAQRATDTLDGGWDRRLRLGAVAPDVTIDLHGHSLAQAHAALDRRLGDALAAGARVVLVITGRPPRPDAAGGERPRGVIRASIDHWIAASRHAGSIAAVRHAHPRHGGTGAIYLVLRRNRTRL